MRGFLSDNNPNDAIGGGGCVCSPIKNEDCKPPYCVFPATETDSNISPHVVISVTCARAIAKEARKPGSVLSLGEKVVDPNAEATL